MATHLIWIVRADDPSRLLSMVEVDTTDPDWDDALSAESLGRRIIGEIKLAERMDAGRREGAPLDSGQPM